MLHILTSEVSTPPGNSLCFWKVTAQTVRGDGQVGSLEELDKVQTLGESGERNMAALAHGTSRIRTKHEAASCT